jgi:hypothetical protein
MTGHALRLWSGPESDPEPLPRDHSCNLPAGGSGWQPTNHERRRIANQVEARFDLAFSLRRKAK